MATDAAGRILAVRDRFLHDTGAYTPYGIVVPLITATQLPGPYRLRHYHVEFDVVYTNKVMVTPYRGAGRPHGCLRDGAADRAHRAASSGSSRPRCAAGTSSSPTSSRATWA